MCVQIKTAQAGKARAASFYSKSGGRSLSPENDGMTHPAHSPSVDASRHEPISNHAESGHPNDTRQNGNYLDPVDRAGTWHKPPQGRRQKRSRGFSPPSAPRSSLPSGGRQSVIPPFRPPYPDALVKSILNGQFTF